MNRIAATLVFLAACASCASAEDPQLEKVRKVVAKSPALQGVTPEMVTPSSAPGIYQVRRGSAFGYVTADGRYFIGGDMIDLVTGEEITETLRQTTRLDVLNRFGPDRVIEFAPKDPKHVVTVFTDIDCGYCRKLHQQVGEYNAAGITIRYLFYPRSGPDTPSFTMAQQVWCSADRKEALTQAKRGVRIKASTNCKNPILDQYLAGDELGINATPMMVFQDGEIVRGYVPPQALAARLAEKAGQPVKAALGR
jgi:thiol:disulfide interchange protein DsbC